MYERVDSWNIGPKQKCHHHSFDDIEREMDTRNHGNPCAHTQYATFDNPFHPGTTTTTAIYITTTEQWYTYTDTHYVYVVAMA